MNDGIDVQLYEPHPAQQQVHDSCMDEGHMYDTLITGRQFGKTELAMNQALMWALSNSNVVVMWVSPKESQVRKVYKIMVDAVRDAPFTTSHKGSQGDIEIRFVNGSVIKFKSAAAGDSLRGESVHYMILDECAFIAKDLFEEVLDPMLTVTGRKCLVITTPKGKNWVYHHYLLGFNGSDDHKSFRFTSKDNPHANHDKIDRAKEYSSDLTYRQEYLAEFVDGGSIIENIHELCILPHLKMPLPRQIYYGGIDVALKDDFTVISIVDSSGNLVAYERFNQVTGPQLKERIVRYLNKWNPKHTLIEVNNMGQVVYDDLIHVYKLKNLSPFSTTSKSKPEIINNLLDAFSSKSIKCVDDEVVKSELETFEMKITSGGNVKYAAADGFHDDIVMSLAIAREAQDCIGKNQTRVRILR